MSPSRSCLLAVLGVTLLAGGLRFYALGSWSFAIDEGASLQEADELLEGRPLTDNPSTRLPRLVPLGYVLHGLSYRFLGRTEFAARLPAAVLGTALCGLAVAGLWGSLGAWAAVATGLLLALNPEYIFQSQNNRFYTTAALFAVSAVMAAARALQRRSAAWMLVAAGCMIVGMFAHTLVAGLVAGLAVAACLTPTGEARGRWSMGVIVLAATIAVALIAWFHVKPLAHGWNAAVGWGYSTPRAILGGINSLGWPTALLSALGTVFLFADRDPWRWFWSLWAAGWVAALAVLPKLVTYHPSYGFLFQFGPMVLAGYAVGEVGRRLYRTSGRWAAAAWVASAVLLNLPSLASHYVDGSRPDQRAAAQFVADHRQPGEAVYAASPGYLVQYQPAKLADAESLPAADTLQSSLNIVRLRGQAAWLVLPAGRAGREADAQAWLNAHARLAATFRKTRFDYYDFVLDVYHFEGK